MISSSLFDSFKKSLKHFCILIHTVAGSPPRPRLTFNFFIFDMFSLTYDALPAVIIIILAKKLNLIDDFYSINFLSVNLK